MKQRNDWKELKWSETNENQLVSTIHPTIYPLVGSFLQAFFPQTVCPHWRVLTVGVKAGAWSECSICSPAKISAYVHLDCAGSHKVCRATLVCGIFTCKFSHKMALVTCPCAFRLRRLEQNGCRGFGLRHFTCKFAHKMTLVTCPCAFRPRRLAQKRLSLWEDLVEILVTSFLRGPCVIWYRSLWEDLVEILIESSLRGPCMILYRSLWEDLVVILVKSSPRGPCMILHSSFCKDLAEIRVKSSLLGVLLVEILMKSSKGSLHGLAQAPVKSSWSNILWVSLHDLYRPFWEGLVKILFNSSLRGLAFRSWRCSVFRTEEVLNRRSSGHPGEILSKGSFHEDLAAATSYRCHRKFLYEDPVGSSI